MTPELLVMSVTRLSDGVCVAGVDESGRWVRPTRQEPSGWRQLRIADLRDRRGCVVLEVGNVVQWPLGSPVPRGAHSEDVLIGDAYPLLTRRLAGAEILARCAAVCVSNLGDFLRDHGRSLAIWAPRRIEAIDFNFGLGGTGAGRLKFRHELGPENLAVTDLAWRARGRRELARLGLTECRWTPRDLQSNTGLTVRYLAIGKGQAEPGWQREHDLAGRFWPFVITVFTEPLNREPIDYARL